MNPDPASLANLRDIVTPPPVPWWPPAPGWWFLLSALGLIAVLVAVHGWRRWRADAYRRAALRELCAAESVASIAELLKRAALAASPRTQVASLTGSAWVKWLAETGGRPRSGRGESSPGGRGLYRSRVGRCQRTHRVRCRVDSESSNWQTR